MRYVPHVVRPVFVEWKAAWKTRGGLGGRGVARGTEHEHGHDHSTQPIVLHTRTPHTHARMRLVLYTSAPCIHTREYTTNSLFLSPALSLSLSLSPLPLSSLSAPLTHLHAPSYRRAAAESATERPTERTTAAADGRGRRPERTAADAAQPQSTLPGERARRVGSALRLEAAVRGDHGEAVREDVRAGGEME